MARPVLTPREDREVFVVPLEVRPEHIDANGHVNNVVYVGWLQDVGTAHWNARFDAETRARCSWVALRHEIDYLRAIAPGATGIVARTWVGDPGAALQPLCPHRGRRGPGLRPGRLGMVSGGRCDPEAAAHTVVDAEGVRDYFSGLRIRAGAPGSRPRSA
jgi:hypothetical protein